MKRLLLLALLGSAANAQTPPAPAAAPAPEPAPAAAAPMTGEADSRRNAPALVVDMPPEAAAAAAAAAQAPATAAVPLTSEERFTRRVQAQQPERVRATQMTGLATTIPQGATIEAVLETAINSDLPGFARAVVSRDVRGFDGTRVLVPRGSRVIGEYKSGVALGASRVFVIWSRLIRPDGVTVQLASPATDDLGRAGLGGDVDRHFLQRFGGSILLSVLNAGLTAAAASVADGTGIFIGSTNDATNLASEALKGTNIAPTVKTPQGAAVRIFVASDLDFSGVR
jgi:type IV secretion system protein VirB10